AIPAVHRDSAVAVRAAPRSTTASLVDTLVTRRPDYRLLVHALARYRALAADTTIPAFPTPRAMPVRPGDSLAAIAALRARLIALGDLDRAADPATGDRYAGALVDGVRRFQRRHGLDPDGILGAATLTALQTPLALRVREIELSLDRTRAEPPVDSGPYIVVNVPAFRLFAWNAWDGDTVPALDMRAIVGKAVRTPTPTLVNQLRYLDFWPEWNVPRSILVNEILPILRRDSLYLHREHMELVGRGDVVLGDKVSPAAIKALTAGALRVRQRRGPTNPLGRVKFVIPNDSNIYLHDTPNKALFERARRDFSHGCIRLEHARELAIWAMRDHSGWDADSVDAAMARPQFRRVTLPRTIPVVMEYNTAMATADGTVWFLPDVYHRDRAILNAWRDSLAGASREH
ncbi:MAG TPA: L,D-transpeptidase family protein, partial [Gemmatimonadaceae bacterium]|nr:L,D-transpeptidase family protein [Gemmatimonadaceae bacterium]